MLNTVSQYIRDAKKKKYWRSGRWTGEYTSALQQGQRLSAVIGRKVVLRREAIGFQREDVALISNVSHTVDVSGKNYTCGIGRSVSDNVMHTDLG